MPVAVTTLCELAPTVMALKGLRLHVNAQVINRIAQLLKDVGAFLALELLVQVPSFAARDAVHDKAVFDVFTRELFCRLRLII